MKPKSIFFIAILALVATIIYYSMSGGKTDAEYVADIQKQRTAKDEFMHTSDQSPFGKEKKNFKTLNYFPVDVKLKINARLNLIRDKQMIVLTSSDGKERKYLPYAYAEFELNNERHKLLILEIVDDPQNNGLLFLAFADATSANETYGAGRYLDVKKVPGASTIMLDFNEAYNPYCAYSENYSCPLPPKENILNTPILAGEKKYHD